MKQPPEEKELLELLEVTTLTAKSDDCGGSFQHSRIGFAVSTGVHPLALHSQQAVVQPPEVHALTIRVPSSNLYQLIADS